MRTVAAACILLLAQMSAGRSHQTAVRYFVQIASPGPPDGCGDGRPIVVKVVDGGHVTLNGRGPLDIDGLAPRLHEIYDARAERVMFVQGGPNVPFRSVAEVIGIAKQQIEVVAFLTPSVEKEECWHVRQPSPMEWVSAFRQPPQWP